MAFATIDDVAGSPRYLASIRYSAVGVDPTEEAARGGAYGWLVDQLMVRMRQSSESRVSTMSCVLMYFSGLPSSYSAREMTQAVSAPWNVMRGGRLTALTGCSNSM